MHQTHSLLASLLLTGLCSLTLVSCGASSTDTTENPPAPTMLRWVLDKLQPAPTNTVALLDTLAQKFLTERRYPLAEQHSLQALRIREDAWGSGHPHVAMGLDQLAEISRVQGKYSEAERLFQNALAIREKALGAEHAEVAATLERYAALLRQVQREPEAQPLEARAQAIRAQQTQAQRSPS